MRLIRVGILGTGFGKVHAHIYNKINEVEIAGIFGRNPEKLRELEKKFKVKVTTDINELISDPTIDLIDICLPTSLHAKYVIKALENGKHVYCETPVSYTLEEAEEMKKYAEQYNKKVFVDLFYKFSAPHKYACDIIKSNKFGKPTVVTTYNRTPPIWGDLGLENIVLNFMLHNYDFLTEIMGMPEAVMTKGIGQDKKAHIISTLNYRNGFASVESSSLMPKEFPFSIGFSVICESGAITYEGQFGENTVEKTVVYHENGEVEEVSFSPTDEYEEAIKHVISCIKNNSLSSCISIDEAIKSLKIAIAAHESLKKI